MSATTLSGPEAHSLRRIDFEANLLEAWVVERRDTKRQALFRVGGLVALVIGAAWCIPYLTGQMGDLSLEQKTATVRLRMMDAISPKPIGGISGGDLGILESSKHNADATFAQIVDLLNTASPSMALSSVRAELVGGDLRLTGAADAENEYSANEFVRQNHGMTRIASSRVSALGANGITFQFVKKVGPAK